MDIKEFRASMVSLITALIPDIGDDYRAFGYDDEDSDPSMLVTIGADADGWSYQTGDNSFTGGAYSYADWAVVAIDRDCDPEEIADDIIYELGHVVEGIDNE